MAAVNIQTIRERLDALLPQLREADRKLERVLDSVEDLFEAHLPAGSYGCVLLKAPERGHPCWAHVVYRDGIFWLDLWRSDRHAHREDLTHCDVREYKILFLHRIKDVWLACGGNPALFYNKSRPYVREFGPRPRPRPR